MNGPSEWPKTNRIKLLPPKFVRQAGRPKKVRRRDINEVKKAKGKDVLTRWIVHTCKHCGIEGHNIRTCPKKKPAFEDDIGPSERGGPAKKKPTKGCSVMTSGHFARRGRVARSI
ncbi:hypothetical protein Leryth_016117 [Lithospermum erythrorhizon]|nr:hypothetical protein Leryth_016117 [Lithospermum erythrorhizon]